MLHFAQNNGFSLAASGHYAVVEGGKLYTATNNRKGQSYFLARLSPETLANVRFPLGDFASKEIVRSIAKKNHLHIAQKKESQDICFIASNYGDYLAERGVTTQPGAMVDSKGKIIGEHKGHFFYTIGQRSRVPGLSHRMYVKKIEADKNLVILGNLEELVAQKCVVSELHYLENLPDFTENLWIKIRYNDRFYQGSLARADSQNGVIHFSEPVSAITPGQLAVAYRKTNNGRMQVVASGWIQS